MNGYFDFLHVMEVLLTQNYFDHVREHRERWGTFLSFISRIS